MDFKDRIVELRESTGMTRKEFCEYFHIPWNDTQGVLRVLPYPLQDGDRMGT